MNELLLCSATELAHKIKSKTVSSIEVINAHIDRIQQVNCKLNAVVQPLFEQARAAAKKADRLVGSGGDLPPFLGVPCTIKESFAVRSLPQTSGMVSRQDHIASVDAPVVSRMKSAGLIPLGTTNVS